MNAAAPLPRPAIRWIDPLCAVALGGVLLWLVLGLGGFRPETRVIPLLGLLGLIVGRLLLRGVGLLPADPGGGVRALWPLPFLAAAALNVCFVTPVPWLGWADWTTWAFLAAGVWLGAELLPRPIPRRIVLGALLLAAVGSVALACYQRWIDPDWLMLGRTQSRYLVGRAGGGFGSPNSQAALLVLLIPFVGAAGFDRTRSGIIRLAALTVMGVLLLGLVLTISRGAWLALVAALAIWPLLTPAWSWRRRLGTAGAALAAGLLVGMLVIALVPAARQRFVALASDRGEVTRPVMWQGAWALFRDAPLTGTGAGSYNVLFERYRPAGFRDDPQWAHNEYLNTLSDHGLIGVVLLGGGLLVAVGGAMRAGRGRDADARAWGVGLIAFGLTLGLDFHLKFPALALAAGVALAALLQRPPPPTAAIAIPVGPGPRRWPLGPLIAAVGVAGLGGMWVLPNTRSEAARYGARQELDGLATADPASPATLAVVSASAHRFARAVELDPTNAQAWSDLAYAESLSAHAPAADAVARGRAAEASARQALALAPVVAEFWWRLGVALDLQGRWIEAGAAFAESLRLAPHSPLAWYHQAYHFSLRPHTHTLARAAATTCLQLEPAHFPARDLLRRLDLH